MSSSHSLVPTCMRCTLNSPHPVRWAMRDSNEMKLWVIEYESMCSVHVCVFVCCSLSRSAESMIPASRIQQTRCKSTHMHGMATKIILEALLPGLEYTHVQNDTVPQYTDQLQYSTIIEPQAEQIYAAKETGSVVRDQWNVSQHTWHRGTHCGHYIAIVHAFIASWALVK